MVESRLFLCRYVRHVPWDTGLDFYQDIYDQLCDQHPCGELAIWNNLLLSRIQ